MRLQGKSAVVTGAASGIGYAVAKRFLTEGAQVVAADIRGLDTLAQEWDPSALTTVKTDVSDRAQVERMIDLAVEAFGRVDILVNNAGVMDNMTPVGELSDELWDRVMRINLNGVMYACRHAVPFMLEQPDGGTIINVSSVGGIQGSRAGAAYTASKHAVVGLSKNIGFMYAQQNVRCNVICPGAVVTDIQSGLQTPSALGMERAMIGLAASPRSAEPEEIASVALFLASDDASFINGAVITADAGWTAY